METNTNTSPEKPDSSDTPRNDPKPFRRNTFDTVRELYLQTELEKAEAELAARDALIGELKGCLKRIDKKCEDGNEDPWTIVAKVGDLAIEALRRADGKEGA